MDIVDAAMKEVARITDKAFAEQDATITALRARVEELEGALGESYSTLAAAFNRVHCLPRTTDTDLANRIEVTRAKIAALRAKGGEHRG